MRRMLVFAFTNRLETPHMIAQFGAAQQTRVSHVIQIAKGRCFVDALLGQVLRNVSVGQR